MAKTRTWTTLLAAPALAALMLTFTALNVYADSSALKLSPTQKGFLR